MNERKRSRPTNEEPDWCPFHGEIPPEEREGTYCPQCGRKLYITGPPRGAAPEYVWSVEDSDTVAVRLIKEELHKAWLRNTPEEGYEWNRDSHGLLRALRAVKRDA